MPQSAQIKYDEHTKIFLYIKYHQMLILFYFQTMIKTYMSIIDCLQDEGNLYVIYLVYKYYKELTLIP